MKLFVSLILVMGLLPLGTPAQASGGSNEAGYFATVYSANNRDGDGIVGNRLNPRVASLSCTDDGGTGLDCTSSGVVLMVRFARVKGDYKAYAVLKGSKLNPRDWTTLNCKYSLKGYGKMGTIRCF